MAEGCDLDIYHGKPSQKSRELLAGGTNRHGQEYASAVEGDAAARGTGGSTLALTAPLAAAASTATPPTMTASWAKPRHTFAVSEHCKAPLHDHVELTPGGHRKHSLQRTSPGGTTRTAHYVSPLKGDYSTAGAALNGSGILEDASEVDHEQYFRRCDALNEVPGSQSDAQRSAVARAKRKAGVPAAPQAKRCDRKPWGTVQREYRGSGMKALLRVALYVGVALGVAHVVCAALESHIE